jgi:hypothetical protein
MTDPLLNVYSARLSLEDTSVCYINCLPEDLILPERWRLGEAIRNCRGTSVKQDAILATKWTTGICNCGYCSLVGAHETVLVARGSGRT